MNVYLKEYFQFRKLDQRLRPYILNLRDRGGGGQLKTTQRQQWKNTALNLFNDFCKDFMFRISKVLLNIKLYLQFSSAQNKGKQKHVNCIHILHILYNRVCLSVNLFLSVMIARSDFLLEGKIFTFLHFPSLILHHNTIEI